MHMLPFKSVRGPAFQLHSSQFSKKAISNPLHAFQEHGNEPGCVYGT